MAPADAAHRLRDLRNAGRVAVVGYTAARSAPQAIWALIPPRRRVDQWDDTRAFEEVDAERRRRVADILDRWARFMRAHCGPDGYPQTAAGFPAGPSVHSFEDLEDQLDRQLVAACHGAIYSLSEHLLETLLYRCGLRNAWTREGSPFDMEDEAMRALADKLAKRVALPS